MPTSMSETQLIHDWREVVVRSTGYPRFPKSMLLNWKIPMSNELNSCSNCFLT